MPPRGALPDLPFQVTRDRLAARLRRGAADGDDADLGGLMNAGSTGVVPVSTAIAGPLGAPFRFALSPEQATVAAAYLTQRTRHGTQGLAPNSRRTRAADWLTWLAFCAHYDRVVLPAAFDDVREFLDSLIGAGRKKATIEHMIWSLADVHRRHGCPNPMDNAVAQDYWKDVVRDRLEGAQTQASPMTLELLETLVTALRTRTPAPRRNAPRLRSLAEHAQHRRRLRDIALLHVAYDLMMRASEVVAMRWGQIERLTRGGATYRFGRTKTDQAGRGRTLYLRPVTLAALDAWQTEAFEGEHVFHAVADDRHLDPASATDDVEAARWRDRAARAAQREAVPLSAREVGSVFRRAVALAGLDPDEQWLSGHSARVGAAQDMVRAGLTTAQVQIAGRWASERMPIRYAERVLATDAGEDRFARLDAMRRKPQG